MGTDLILGTAGHIDHGKTSLIRALTGVDTDRLPEEKKRGITIDLGFAELRVGQYRLGIVDVPGHERFVRNMLAGATGMDLALLVVAADDSIKPQTLEHFEILRLLDLRAGVIALTKCDLVDATWIELVADEIRDFVRGSFLATAPIVRTSTTTGQGLDTLREELARAAELAGQACTQAGQACTQAGRTCTQDTAGTPFRMAIDRTFTIAGHGTVVTGSVSSGGTQVGDELSIEPGGLRVRVRGLQNHDRPVQQVQRGQRAAINLAGVHHEEIERGQELATPGHLRPSRRLTVQLRAVDSLVRPIKNRSRVRVHVGTAELLATLTLLDTDTLGAGRTAYGQLHLAAPAVTTWNQPFVLRSESPMHTVGGGLVLVPDAERLRRDVPETLVRLAHLTSHEPLERAAAALYFAGLHPGGLRLWQPEDLARTAGIENPHDVCEAMRAEGVLCEVAVSPTRTLRFHRDVLDDLCRRVATWLEKLHQQYPLRVTIDRQQVRQGFHYVDDVVFNLALSNLRSAGRIHLSDRGVALEGHGPKLSQNERKLLAQLVENYRQAGLESPTVKQMQQLATKNQASVPQLIALAAANGDLVEIHADYFLHADVDRAVRQRLTESLSGGTGLTVSQIREILNTSRKFAVPYCEYLDRIGFTRRESDVRWLAVPARGTADP
ncbi:MAG: selenocysteine-specific translation elongation factor [Pirellulaceae bacterium]